MDLPEFILGTVAVLLQTLFYLVIPVAILVALLLVVISIGRWLWAWIAG